MRHLPGHSHVHRLADGLFATSRYFRQYSFCSGEERQVVVTGLGLVTPLGSGVAESWSRLIQGQSGVRKLSKSDLPEVGCTCR